MFRTDARPSRDGGVLIASTINRNMKSYALAIVAAEYILRWLPRGTHQWERFITPDEMAKHMTAAGLSAPRFSGMIYNPMADDWRLSEDTDVNYLAAAGKG
jgi:2-polyprenyl-6-hydroxyphenyl methylase/3-demethylubiquinone-9 3-methyltransferase